MTILLLAVGGGLSGALPVILVVAACIFFLLACGTAWAPAPSPWYPRLVPAGLLCLSLAQLITMLGGL